MLPRYPDGIGGFRPTAEETKKITKPKDTPPPQEERTASPENSTEYPAWFTKRYSVEQIQRAEHLSRLIEDVSTQQNNFIKREFRTKFDLINKFGMLDARMFADTQGGNIPKARAEKHKEYVVKMERRLAAVEPFEDEGIAGFQKRKEINMKKFDLSDKDPERDTKLVKAFQLERGMSENFQLEKVFVVTFAKLLGPEFVIFRAPDYEDYQGTDTYVLDTKTGRIVCALDEVLDKFISDQAANLQENKRVQEKIHTAKVTNEKGGKFIEYGIKIVEKNGQRIISREPIDHTPLFSVAIKKAELENLLASYETADSPTEASSSELDFFKTILASWRAQAKALPAERRRFNKKNKNQNAADPLPSNRELEAIFTRMEKLAHRFAEPSNT